MNQVAGASPAQKSSRGLVGAAFIGTLLLALGLRLVVATTLPTLAWPDEIFQTMEQAHRLVFGYGIVPWEFRLGARSWLFPGLLAAVMELGRPFGGQGYLRAVQVAMACLSLVPIAVAFSWANRRHGMLPALVASFAATTSFELVYFSTRALTEVAAAHVVVAALYMSSVDNPQRRQLLLSGVDFGLAAVLRFHLTPAIIASLALFCGRSPSRWRLVLAGMAVPVIGAGLGASSDTPWPPRSPFGPRAVVVRCLRLLGGISAFLVTAVCILCLATYAANLLFLLCVRDLAQTAGCDVAGHLPARQRHHGIRPSRRCVERRHQRQAIATRGDELLLGPHPDFLDRLQTVGHEGRGKHHQALLSLGREPRNDHVRVGVDPRRTSQTRLKAHAPGTLGQGESAGQGARGGETLGAVTGAGGWADTVAAIGLGEAVPASRIGFPHMTLG